MGRSGCGDVGQRRVGRRPVDIAPPSGKSTLFATEPVEAETCGENL